MSAFASNPIEVAYQTGATLYAIIHNKEGTVWNSLNLNFEVYDSSHWSQYAIALTEQAGSGYYHVDYPSDIGHALTTECIYSQVGGSPDISDAQPGPIGIGQAQGVDIAAVAHDETAASNMQVNLEQLQQGSTTSSALSRTQASTNLTSSVSNLYSGRLLIFTTGALRQEVTTITGYNGSTKVLSFNSLTSAPSAGDGFLII